MKNRQITGIVFYIIAVVFFFINHFQGPWYIILGFAFFPALIGYFIGGIFDYHPREKILLNDVVQNSAKKPHYKWILSIATMILSAFLVFGGTIGSHASLNNTIDRQFLTAEILFYVVLPTIIIFILGYIIDKFKH